MTASLSLMQVMLRLTLLQACWDPARMQAGGLAFALDPWLKRCWRGDLEGLRAARLRQLAHFNTHPYAAWLVAGAFCTLEAEAAAASGAMREAVLRRGEALRAKTSCSLAALYDSFFWGALRPASAAVGAAVFFAANKAGLSYSAAAGAGTALLLYNAPALVARWWGFRRGLERGEKAVLEIARLPGQSWIVGLRRIAAGAAIAALGVFAYDPWPFPRIWIIATFLAAAILSARSVPILAQAGLAGLLMLAIDSVGRWR